MRGDPIGLAGRRLNHHSAKVSILPSLAALQAPHVLYAPCQPWLLYLLPPCSVLAAVRAGPSPSIMIAGRASRPSASSLQVLTALQSATKCLSDTNCKFIPVTQQLAKCKMFLSLPSPTGFSRRTEFGDMTLDSLSTVTRAAAQKKALHTSINILPRPGIERGTFRSSV